MKIVSNDKLISRNSKIGKYTTLASLAVLTGGLVLSFRTESITYMTISIGALFLGFVLSQIGIHYTTRWGRPPRVDERLTQSLKGLDDKYTLYHYTSPVSHLLVGPAGIWVLIPYFQRGKIFYDEVKNRWRQSGVSLFLKLFAQETLTRPDIEVRSQTEDMRKFLGKNAGENYSLPVQSAIVFTDPRAEVDAANAPIPTMEADKLKDFIRKKAKTEPVKEESFRMVQNLLPK